MSGRIRVRRHHRSAQSRGWAVQPETLALFIPVVLAVILMPLGMGGRHPIGQLFLSSAAVAAAGAWFVRCYHRNDAGWEFSILDLLFATGMAVAVIQVIPFSAALIKYISPHLSTLLPCWTDGPWTLGQWTTISLSPGETFVGIGIFAAQIVLVGCIFQSIRSSQDIERILLVVAVATGLMAALGVVQYLTSNGNYLWFYEFAFNDTRSIVKGTFSNRNHYASFLAIGVGSLIWWTFKPDPTKQDSKTSSQESSRSTRKRQRSSGTQSTSDIQPEYRLAIGLVVLGVTTFSVLLSLSRGGTMSLAAVGLVTTGMLFKTKRITPKVAGGFLAVILLLGTALTIHGMDSVNTRLDTIWTELGDIFSDEKEAGFGGRREVWQAAVETITDFPVLGTGIGSHAAITKAYMPPTDKVICTHAENSYLNLGVETGLIGLGIAIISLLVGFVCCGVVFFKGTAQEQIIAIALTGSLTAGTVHAAGDFIWYVPACSTLMMLLGACAVKLASSHTQFITLPRLNLDRASAAIASVGAVTVLLFVGHSQLQASKAQAFFENSIKQSRILEKLSRQSTSQAALYAATTKIKTPDSPAKSTNEQGIAKELEARIDSLEKTVALQPNHSQAWTDLAFCKLERFGLTRLIAGETIGLTEIRQTVEQTHFESTEACTTWIQKITGDDFQDLTQAMNAALRAVTINPCAGNAWCVLAATSFLNTQDSRLPQACIKQALRVRPHEGQVLFEAANQAELDGSPARAMQLREQCFAECPSERGRILNVLIPMMSGIQTCELLTPDVTGLRAIDRLWSQSSSKEEMKPVKKLRLAKVYEAAQQVKGTTQSNLLYEAAVIERTLGNTENAAASITAALVANSNNYQMRLMHIDLALALGDAATAKQEIDWCLLRRPDSQKLQGRIQQLKQLRIKQASIPSTLDDSITWPGERR
ncbi:O-antigen ligase family protein [Pirellulales bacterium]|nr:O-antigen ligase family protein [Pirellulales bacterium]